MKPFIRQPWKVLHVQHLSRRRIVHRRHVYNERACLGEKIRKSRSIMGVGIDRRFRLGQQLEIASTIWNPLTEVYKDDIESIQKQFVIHLLDQWRGNFCNRFHMNCDLNSIRVRHTMSRNFFTILKICKRKKSLGIEQTSLYSCQMQGGRLFFFFSFGISSIMQR